MATRRQNRISTTTTSIQTITTLGWTENFNPQTKIVDDTGQTRQTTCRDLRSDSIEVKRHKQQQSVLSAGDSFHNGQKKNCVQYAEHGVVRLYVREDTRNVMLPKNSVSSKEMQTGATAKYSFSSVAFQIAWMTNLK
jgi:hypothetical protein